MHVILLLDGSATTTQTPGPAALLRLGIVPTLPSVAALRSVARRLPAILLN
jgi:hypothetical protein